MSKTAREILTEVLKAGATYGRDGRYFAGKSDIDQAIKELEAIMSEQVIGKDCSDEVSGGSCFDCEMDSGYYANVHNELKDEQRQALHTALYGEDEK